MTRWASAWGPAAFWAAVLFILSSRSSLGVSLDGGLDKVAHLIAYFVLGVLLAYAAARLGLSPVVAVLAGWTYGFLDELHQSFVPGRFAEFGDWVADAVGAALGVIFFFTVLRRRLRIGETMDTTTKTT